MSDRYRWYRVKLPSSVGDLQDLLAKSPLTENKSNGFSWGVNEDGVKECRFFWKTKISVTFLDESGNPSCESIESISFTDFSIAYVDGFSFIRIKNPGRSVRELFNAIERAAGLGFTVRPVTLDDQAHTAILESVDSYRLTGLKVVDATVGKDLLAKMEFTSKRDGLMGEIKTLDGVSYKVSYSTYDLLFNGLKGSITISANGTVKVSGQITQMLLGLLESSLPLQFKSKE